MFYVVAAPAEEELEEGARIDVVAAPAGARDLVVEPPLVREPDELLLQANSSILPPDVHFHNRVSHHRAGKKPCGTVV